MQLHDASSLGWVADFRWRQRANQRTCGHLLTNQRSGLNIHLPGYQFVVITPTSARMHQAVIRCYKYSGGSHIGSQRKIDSLGQIMFVKYFNKSVFYFTQVFDGRKIKWFDMCSRWPGEVTPDGFMPIRLWGIPDIITFIIYILSRITRYFLQTYILFARQVCFLYVTQVCIWWV